MSNRLLTKKIMLSWFTYVIHEKGPIFYRENLKNSYKGLTDIIEVSNSILKLWILVDSIIF